MKLQTTILCALVAMLTIAWSPSALAGTKKDKKEEEIALDKVPQKVIETAEKAVDGIKLEEAEKEIKGKHVVYELEGKVDGNKYEIQVREDGTLLKVELDNDDDDEDDDDDDDDDKEK